MATISIWMLPPGHCPEKLADAIIHLKTHPEEARAIGLAGGETSVREFSLLKHGQRLKQFLQELQDRRTAAGKE